MLTTKRSRPRSAKSLSRSSCGPWGFTQAALAAAMGVQRKHVNELCTTAGL